MNTPVQPADLEIDYGPLYAAHKKVYPQATHGTFRTIKWALMGACLGIYYGLPFVRWDRGPNAPGQAVLVDLPNRRFYFFFIELWPQEVYYFTGLLIVAAMALFLMNAVGGRLWCGYLCPQTVWTDLFYAVERLVEGDRRERMKKEKSGFTLRRGAELVTKHAIWIMIAWWTGGAWVLYFADAPTLVHDLATLDAPLIAYIWIGILTFTTYALAGFMREQVCVYMCPWPRIQAALTDEWALNVTYRYDRGEPRTALKKAEEARAKGEPAGDCIDCYQCVAVCPTGIDIRDGAQLECIQCGLCVDACDNVMEKIGRPKRLIAYDNDVNIKRRQAGKDDIYRIVRPRTMLYSAIIVLVGAIMVYTLATRSFLEVNVLHDRNPVFVNLSDGSVRNGYTVRLLNKRNYERHIAVGFEGPSLAKVETIGIATVAGSRPIVTIGPDQTREIRMVVSIPPVQLTERSIPVTFRATDLVIGETATTRDNFIAR